MAFSVSQIAGGFAYLLKRDSDDAVLRRYLRAKDDAVRGLRIVGRPTGSNPRDTDTFSVEAEKVWVWKTADNEYFFDDGTPVRVRIETEKWNSQTETPVAAVNENADTKMRAQVPYSIEASIAEAGLGGFDWW